ncbi:MAG: pyridoxamine 5'-phosphate oxidase [Deinococcota bacterium]
MPTSAQVTSTQVAHDVIGPIELFKQWYAHALNETPLKHPSAVCVSTVSPEGLPEARFVSLKEVTEAGFVFCSSLTSPKGVSIDANAQVALTFWWDHIERQVRIVGTAQHISDEDARRYFRERSRDAQLITLVSQQSRPLESQAVLEQNLHAADQKFEGKDIPRPVNWGGYCVRPTSIEFLEFQQNRVHQRTYFWQQDNDWCEQRLQP